MYPFQQTMLENAEHDLRIMSRMTAFLLIVATALTILMFLTSKTRWLVAAYAVMFWGLSCLGIVQTRRARVNRDLELIYYVLKS